MIVRQTKTTETIKYHLNVYNVIKLSCELTGIVKRWQTLVYTTHASTTLFFACILICLFWDAWRSLKHPTKCIFLWRPFLWFVFVDLISQKTLWPPWKGHGVSASQQATIWATKRFFGVYEVEVFSTSVLPTSFTSLIIGCRPNVPRWVSF